MNVEVVEVTQDSQGQIQDSQGQIPGELIELFAALDVMSSTVEVLEKSLSPILNSSEVEKNDNVNSKATLVLVPLAKELRRCRSKVFALTNRLDELHRRVEL